MDRRVITAMLLTAGCLCVLSGCNGCGCAGGKVQDGDKALVMIDDLPAGWALLPDSEMPPIDKTPWWVQNPQVLKGSDVKQLDVGGKSTKACKVWAAIYGNEEHRVAIICVIYPTPQEAETEYKTMTQDQPSSESFQGRLKDRADVIVSMFIPDDCSDRGFFVKHFELLTRQNKQ